MEVILKESPKHYILIVFGTEYVYTGDTIFCKEWVINQLKKFGKPTTLLEKFLENGEIRNFGAYDTDYFLRIIIIPKKPYKAFQGK